MEKYNSVLRKTKHRSVHFLGRVFEKGGEGRGWGVRGDNYFNLRGRGIRQHTLNKTAPAIQVLNSRMTAKYDVIKRDFSSGWRVNCRQQIHTDPVL